MKKGTIAIAIALVLSAGPAQAGAAKELLSKAAELMMKYVEEHSDEIAHHALHPAHEAVLAYLKEKTSPAPVPPKLTVTDDQRKQFEEAIRRMREDPQFLADQQQDAKTQDALRLLLGAAP